MKRIAGAVPFLAVLAIIIIPPPPGGPVVADADCDGFQLSGSTTDASYLVATATLERDLAGVWIPVDTSIDDLVLPPGGGVIDMENTWNMELVGGDYRVMVQLDTYLGSFLSVPTPAELALMTPQTETLESGVFTCAATGSALGTRTPGFWKNHAEIWSNISFNLGAPGDMYDQACMLDILNQRVRGDVRIILAKHLIAAKLNLLTGVDPGTVTGYPTPSSTILDTILEGDAYMAAFVPYDPDCVEIFDGSKPAGADKAEGGTIKDYLDAFNNGQF